MNGKRRTWIRIAVIIGGLGLILTGAVWSQNIAALELWAALIVLYWAPSIIAWRRHVTNLGSVIVVNFFGFALGIGWVVALAWACKSVTPRPAEGELTR